MKPKPIESWIVPESQSLKFRYLERNVYIAIFVAILIMTAGGIWIIRSEMKRNEQFHQEQKAIQENHAVNIQGIPDWVFEIRKPKPSPTP